MITVVLPPTAAPILSSLQSSIFYRSSFQSYKLKLHVSSFPRGILVAFSRHSCEDVANKLRGNRACRTCRARMLYEDVRNKSGVSAVSAMIYARTSRGCYAENGPVEFKLYRAPSSIGLRSNLILATMPHAYSRRFLRSLYPVVCRPSVCVLPLYSAVRNWRLGNDARQRHCYTTESTDSKHRRRSNYFAPPPGRTRGIVTIMSVCLFARSKTSRQIFLHQICGACHPWRRLGSLF